MRNFISDIGKKKSSDGPIDFSNYFDALPVDNCRLYMVTIQAFVLIHNCDMDNKE